MSTAQATASKATMRAAFFGEPGPAEAIEVGELPVPVPGPTDVLVAVEVAVINPVDTLIRSGRWPTLMPLPFVTGRDLVGTVTAAGAGSGFSPGDRVWSNSLGHAGRQGTCAEYAVVPGDRLYPLPGGAVATEAAAAFHSPATAFIGLHHRARARAGQTILVGGAAGGIGSALVRFASEAGLRVIATAVPATMPAASSREPARYSTSATPTSPAGSSMWRRAASTSTGTPLGGCRSTRWSP
jgi:NADPH:quinone reductase-like Zn-dependent oxidoreductase